MRTEAIIICELVRHGYRVLQPIGFNHRYDLLLDCGTRFIRVQCKTGRLRNGVILFATHSTRSNMSAVSSRSYAGEVDMFMVFCPGTSRVYAVPIEDVPERGGALRVTPPLNRQQKRVRWATDYELGPEGIERKPTVAG